MDESVGVLTLESTMALLHHKDVCVRKASWRNLRAIYECNHGLLCEKFQQLIGDAFIGEKQLEVVESALSFFQIFGSGLRGERCRELLAFLIENNLVSRHPVLFKRLVEIPLVIFDLDTLLRREASSCTILREIQRTGHFSSLQTDLKIELIEELLRSDNPNVVYGGLLILEQCAMELGVKISNLQFVLGRLFNHEDSQISYRCLLILLKIATASNWESLINLSLEIIGRGNQAEISFETHLWNMKIVQKCVETIEEFCRADKSTFILKLLRLVPEKATASEINSIATTIRDRSYEFHDEPFPSRMLIRSRLLSPSKEVELRTNLLDLEEDDNCSLKLDDPFKLFRSSIFYSLPLQIASPLPETEGLEISPTRIELDLPSELMMNVFAGFTTEE